LASMNRPRVVLAEDHAQIAVQLRRLLESKFDVVAMVLDGDALLRTAEEFHPMRVVLVTAHLGRGSA
jgi:CheY-like chemotaxis protein